MVLGFISLLMTFVQNYVAQVCIPRSLGDTMLPCMQDSHHDGEESFAVKSHRRRLLSAAAGGSLLECKPVGLKIRLNFIDMVTFFFFDYVND